MSDTMIFRSFRGMQEATARVSRTPPTWFEATINGPVDRHEIPNHGQSPGHRIQAAPAGDKSKTDLREPWPGISPRMVAK